MKEGEEVVFRPFEEKLVREQWFAAVIGRLAPLVASEPGPGVSITKTDAKWLFEIVGFEEMSARITALETRLAGAKAVAFCEDGMLVVEVSI